MSMILRAFADWPSKVAVAAAAIAVLGTLAFSSAAQAVTVNVIDSDGVAVAGFKWLLQEDRTFPVTPGVESPMSGSFHRSHHPVLASGLSTGNSAAIALPGTTSADRYFISVLPHSGTNMSGVAVNGLQDGDTMTVTVNTLALPPAQITVFAFEDHFPLNGAMDTPVEIGLADFEILLFEAAGTYGLDGQVLVDAFGNPLGTIYLANGDIDVLGDGRLFTGADGTLVIQNLPPAKYAVQIVPPRGQGWSQTSTIEGGKQSDAWVKANEPLFFTEFGPVGPHVFFGFTKAFTNPLVLTGGATISGTVTGLHTSRPPDTIMYNADPVPATSCWAGLNTLAGLGPVAFATACDENNAFSIPDVPPGNYQVVVWDAFNITIIAYHNITVNADLSCDTPNGGCAMPAIPVFNWNTRLENWVFFDANENGFRDVDEFGNLEPGIPEQATILRFRDGSVYSEFPTDLDGYVPYDTVFPFFSWLVIEIDFGRFKATGVTAIVDAGGPVPADDGWNMPSRGLLNPQPQVDCTDNGALADPRFDCVDLVNPNTGNNLSRTEPSITSLPGAPLEGAPVLTQAFQGFIGQTTILEWGKTAYAPGENGGISGLVMYGVTRAENDPRYTAGEEWEAGIPRVQVNLYQDFDADGVIDDINGGGIQLADIDNYPLGWSEGGARGDEDVDRNGNGTFDQGDAYRVGWTDSWDDNLPEGCVNNTTEEPFVYMGEMLDCYDGLRNFNQVRNGLFDGGYAFGSVADLADPLPANTYIVEAATPPGYELLAEESKNVDFGIEVSPALLPPICVGDDRLVPAYLTFNSDGTNPLPGVDPADLIEAPFAGTLRPGCDRKQIVLRDQQNAAGDFFLFTEVPYAAHIFGFVLDDLANEFDPNSPQFGEKFGPPWLPVAIRDWTGREITRAYTDRYGRYNILVPSSYSANVPNPSGWSPAMLTYCINDPGPMADPANPGQTIMDPAFNRQYSQFCYTLQHMPGKTTYADTPVLPIAAFAGPGQDPLDCECEDGSPGIYSVSGPSGGPLVPSNFSSSITIVSQGMIAVPNPLYCGPDTTATCTGTEPITIMRDYGFSTAGGTVTLDGVPLDVDSWSDGAIAVGIPAMDDGSTGQLLVTRGDNGKTSKVGITLHVRDSGVHHVTPSPTPGATPIQDAIDLAADGDLILVAPGNYMEMVILHKRVQLQGWGAGSTIINATPSPGETLAAWRDKLVTLHNTGNFDLLPGQEAIFGITLGEAEILANNEGAGILVLGNQSEALGAWVLDPVGPVTRPATCDDPKGVQDLVRPPVDPRIDGFTVGGSSRGGGIVVGNFSPCTEISNNRISSNQGVFGGGIRVGDPSLVQNVGGGVFEYVDSQNDGANIHHNQITTNGGLDGAGGGVSINMGSDNYVVADNFVCGNRTQGDGGGIGHFGLSNGGMIANNTVVFNQSFNQGLAKHGGGIFIGGQPSLVIDPVTLLPVGMGPGSGSVTVDGNLIQGNLTGSGDGGGIRLSSVSIVVLEDVAPPKKVKTKPARLSRSSRRSRTIEPTLSEIQSVIKYSISITNNMIVNNIAGMAGGGISMQDVPLIDIINNTIANNDSTATAGAAAGVVDPGTGLTDPNVSNPQPAGVVSYAHGSDLMAALAPVLPLPANFSDPKFRNNIIWQNRSFHFDVDDTVDPPVILLLPNVVGGDTPVYDDLAVLGTATSEQLTPVYSLLTDTTGYSTFTNFSDDPNFVTEYVNTSREAARLLVEPTTGIEIMRAFDEGGNDIEIKFGPLTLIDPTGSPYGDYHLQNGSPAREMGNSNSAPDHDFDGEPRPRLGGGGDRYDIGADEVQ